MNSNDEEIPIFGAPLRAAVPANKASADDLVQQPTILLIRDLFVLNIENLQHGFNAFDTNKTADDLKVEVIANQKAYAILSGVLNEVNTILAQIERK